MSTRPSSMELEVFPSDFGLPALECDSLQFLACTRFCAAPVRVNSKLSPWQSPTGEYPVFRDGDGAVITDFEKFTDYLRQNAQDVVLDGDLTTSEKSELYAFSCMLKNRLYPAQLFTLWMDDSNFNTVTNHWFASNLTFPYNMYYVQRRRKSAIAYLRNMHAGKLITDAEIEFAVTRQALFCINMLATKLGDKKYFYGDKPSSLDALVFGYLAPLLKLPLPSDRLQQHLKSCPNLVRFVESIISIYLPLTDDELSKQRRARDRWDLRRIKAQDTMKRKRIREQERKTQEANAAKEGGEFYLRDTILFGVAAVTLTILFAVHTGLITITRVDRSSDVDSEMASLPAGMDFQNAFTSEYD